MIGLATYFDVVLGLVGATIIFCRGDIFAQVRRVWPKFLTCTLCVGFWVGLAGAWWKGARHPVDLLLSGALVGLVALVVDAWLVRTLGDPKEG